MDNRWEHKLRDKMSRYSQPEPEGLWEDIMRQMESAVLLNTTRKRRKQRKTVTILSSAAAAAAIAAFVFLHDGRTPPVLSGMNAAALTEAAGIDIAGKPGAPAPLYLYPRELTADAADHAGQPAGITGDSDGAAQDTVVPATPSPEVRHEDKGYNSRRPQSVTELPDNMLPEEIFDGKSREKRSRKTGRFSTSLSVSNLTGSRQSMNGYRAMQSATSAFKGIPAANAFMASSDEASMILDRDSQSDTKIRHRQPVRAGVSFRYFLTDSWALESGVVYSYLASEMETGNAAEYASNTDQTLHYIGIPLKASFNILDRKFLTVYASAGGMLEKCISGEALTKYSLNGHEISRSEDKLTIKPLQWSVSAEAGIQGNITDHIGIYLEPGISWHFDNGSRISTIYREKPLNFNLEFGIRFSFE